jgi:tRNA threonylcarbamoyladenosine biosynthesis protein TsaE
VTRDSEFDQAGAVPASRWPADSQPTLAEGATLSLAVGTAEEMRELGRRLASTMAAGDLVILSGGLGAGKTTLTKGIGDGLGVRGPITSPTFVIARVHPPVRPAKDDPAPDRPAPSLVHADAYRIGGVLELDDLDLDTDLASSVTVVEWGEGLAEGLSADRLEIAIDPVAAGSPDQAEAEDLAGDLPRRVRISSVGQRWEGIELPLLGVVDRL